MLWSPLLYNPSDKLSNSSKNFSTKIKKHLIFSNICDIICNVNIVTDD